MPLFCPYCGQREDVRTWVEEWMLLPTSDKDTEQQYIPEHQCLGCGRSFWCDMPEEGED